MCINVSLHGPGVWRCVAVHRLALMKTPTNFSLNDVLNAQGDASHLCHNALCINAAHISLEPHWVNIKRPTDPTVSVAVSHDGQQPSVSLTPMRAKPPGNIVEWLRLFATYTCV